MAGYRRNTQRRSSRKASSHSSSLGWVWLFLGMFLGIAGVVFAYGLYTGQWTFMNQKRVKQAPMVIVAPPTTSSSEKPKAPTHIKVQNKNGKTQEFEFYTLLPGMEVQLPDTPSKPPADARVAHTAHATQTPQAGQTTQKTPVTAPASHAAMPAKSKVETHQKTSAAHNHKTNQSGSSSPQHSTKPQIAPPNAHTQTQTHAHAHGKAKTQSSNHTSHNKHNSHASNSSQSKQTKKSVSKERANKNRNDSKNPFAKFFAKKSSKDSKSKAAAPKTISHNQNKASGKQAAAAKRDVNVEKKIAATRYILQTGIFRESKQADSEKSKLASQGFNSQIQKVKTQDGNSWFRVTLGPYTTEPAAVSQKKKLEAKNIRSTLILQRTLE